MSSKDSHIHCGLARPIKSSCVETMACLAIFEYTGLNLPKKSATMVDPFALLRFWRAIFWRVGRRGCSTYTCTVVANHARNRRIFPTKAVPFIKQRLLQAGSARGQGSRQSLCSVSLLTLVSSRTISQHGQRACACPPACLQLHPGLVAGIFSKRNRKATVVLKSDCTKHWNESVCLMR